MIQTRRREGGVVRGEVREQSRIGKGQIKTCRAMVGGEQEHSIDPWSIEERKQVSCCPVEIGRTFKLVVVGEQTIRVGGGVMTVEIHKDKCRKIMPGK